MGDGRSTGVEIGWLQRLPAQLDQNVMATGKLFQAFAFSLCLVNL
jgi:hypothetical protein